MKFFTALLLSSLLTVMGRLHGEGRDLFTFDITIKDKDGNTESVQVDTEGSGRTDPELDLDSPRYESCPNEASIHYAEQNQGGRGVVCASNSDCSAYTNCCVPHLCLCSKKVNPSVEDCLKEQTVNQP